MGDEFRDKFVRKFCRDWFKFRQDMSDRSNVFGSNQPRDELARRFRRNNPILLSRWKELGEDLQQFIAVGHSNRSGLGSPGEPNVSVSEFDLLESLCWSSYVESVIKCYIDGHCDLEELLNWLSEPSPLPAWLERAEDFYRSLGRWKGPRATQQSQDALRDFWREGGEPGARWLVERLRTESNLDTLNGATSLLADLGPFSIRPIVDGLAHDPAPDQALALLRALGEIADDWPHLRFAPRHDVETLLGLFDLQHDDPDHREAACRALRLFPGDSAERWLTQRLLVEQDAEVRQTIEEELSRHQALKV